MIGALAGGALSGFRPETGLPPLFMIKNVDFFVSDENQFADFYAEIFGVPRRYYGGKLRIDTETRSYLQFRRRPPRSAEKRLDCVGIADDRNLPVFLKQAGLPFERPDDETIVMRDPDRLTTEFATAGWFVWDREPGEIATGLEIFSPIRIRSVVLNVADPEVSIRFYQRFLGPPIRRDNNRTWFRVGDCYLGLQHKPDTDIAALHLVGIIAQTFDSHSAVQRLQKIGAIDVRVSSDTSGFGPQTRGSQPPPPVLSFSDPDGLADGFRFEITPGR